MWMRKGSSLHVNHILSATFDCDFDDLSQHLNATVRTMLSDKNTGALLGRNLQIG